MHRHTTGGLASLTANYTDSDASDPENEDEDGESERENGRPTHPTFVQNTNDISNLSLSAVDQGESGTNSISEMGHITDEEQSDTDDRTEIEDDDDDIYHANHDRLAPDNSLDDVQIPPEPVGWCSKQLQEKIAEKYELMVREGLDSNAVIQNQKKFRNPSIYEKLIEFCQIDEMGTNYSPDVYDPRQFDKSSFYEELAKAQKVEMDRRQKEQKERTKIEFISGTKKAAPSSVETRDDSKKRKSKWDVAGNSVVIGPKPSIGVLPQPTTVVGVPSATKATVISAFGTIAKKAKP